MHECISRRERSNLRLETLLSLLVCLLILPDTHSAASVSTNVTRQARQLIADLEASCRAGTASQPISSPSSQPDNRVSLLWLIIRETLPVIVDRRVHDSDLREAGLEILRRSAELMDAQIVPGWRKATQSQDAADAVALLPLLERLDRDLQEFQRIVNRDFARRQNQAAYDSRWPAWALPDLLLVLAALTLISLVLLRNRLLQGLRRFARLARGTGRCNTSSSRKDPRP